MSERLPPPDSRRIQATFPTTDELVVIAARTKLVRVYPLGGSRPLAWNQFRASGPTTSRFDHHPPPRRLHPIRAIAYATRGTGAFTAALAEFFQDGGGGVGPIDVTRDRPAMAIMELAAPLTLLDLDSGWVTRAGGNQAIRTGPRGRSRDWARAIYRHHPQIDGLAYGSSVWGPGECVALWERALPAMPRTPLAVRTLDDPAMLVALAKAAMDLGTFLVGGIHSPS